MQKIIILKGLPGSGKSSYAKKLILDNPGVYKRINKDDLRAMVDVGRWSKENERFVLKLRDSIIREALDQGKSIIIDDTNFNPRHEIDVRNIVNRDFYDREIEIEVKFMDVSIDDCIKRDLRRPNSVGEKVIRNMYSKYLRPKPIAPELDKKLPFAVICDIDGTLAQRQTMPFGKERGPFDWHRVGEDTLKLPIAALVGILSEEKIDIILFSGRDSICRPETEKWLTDNDIPYKALHMRAQGDMRKDCIVKKELFEANIRNKYNILFVLDDRNQVVDMWRNELGLTCLQVDEGEF